MRRNGKQTTAHDLCKFLLNLKLIEQNNSKILTISGNLQSFPKWRVLVRPSGVTILAQSTFEQTLSNSINKSKPSDDVTKFIVTLKNSLKESLHMFD